MLIQASITPEPSGEHTHLGSKPRNSEDSHTGEGETVSQEGTQEDFTLFTAGGEVSAMDSSASACFLLVGESPETHVSQ